MIYLFSGNSSFQIREKTLAWKKLFIEKNGEFNLTHFKDLTEIENNQISEHLLAGGFMGEKKLIIIEDYPLSGDNKNTLSASKQDFLEKVIEKIPEENIVIFSSTSPDKRSKFYKKITKLATKTEIFDAKGESEVALLISKKFSGQIDHQALNLLVRYKGGNAEKSVQEIEKLLITKDLVTVNDISDYIIPELDESIFQIIDLLLNQKKTAAIKKISTLLEQTNIYGFYHGLLANLRTTLYIQKLDKIGVPKNQIGTLLKLGNRAFLVNKNYKISYKSLETLYVSLINIDKKMKTGKLIGSEEKDFLYEIEKTILSNQ